MKQPFSWGSQGKNPRATQGKKILPLDERKSELLTRGGPGIPPSGGLGKRKKKEPFLKCNKGFFHQEKGKKKNPQQQQT